MNQELSLGKEDLCFKFVYSKRREQSAQEILEGLENGK